mgnify:FL=1
MTDADGSQDFLAACDVASEVFDLRPDYRVLLLVTQGLTPDTPTSALFILDALEADAAPGSSSSEVRRLLRRFCATIQAASESLTSSSSKAASPSPGSAATATLQQ